MRRLASSLAPAATLPVAVRWLGACLTLLLSSGCDQKTQKADVFSKDYVPAAKVGGTLSDERQLDHERWLIHIAMDNRLRTDVDVTPEAWRALKVGDRVRVDYEQGRYTGTLWGRKLEKLPPGER